MGSRLGSPSVVPLAEPPFSRVVCERTQLGFTAPTSIGREVTITDSWVQKIDRGPEIRGGGPVCDNAAP
jgi:hypothetical protein